MEATAIVIQQAAPPASKGASKADSGEPGKFTALYQELSAEKAPAAPAKPGNSAKQAEAAETAETVESADSGEATEKTEKVEKATDGGGKGEEPDATPELGIVATPLTPSLELAALVTGPVSQTTQTTQTTQASGEGTVAVSKLTELVAVAPAELNIRQVEVFQAPAAQTSLLSQSSQAPELSQSSQLFQSSQAPELSQSSQISQISQTPQISQISQTPQISQISQTPQTSQDPQPVPALQASANPQPQVGGAFFQPTAQSDLPGSVDPEGKPVADVAAPNRQPVEVEAKKVSQQLPETVVAEAPTIEKSVETLKEKAKGESLPKVETESNPMQPAAQPKSTAQQSDSQEQSAKEELKGGMAKSTKLAKVELEEPKTSQEALPEVKTDPKAEVREVVRTPFEVKTEATAPTGEVRSTEKAQEPVAAQVVRQTHEAVKSGKTEVRIKLDPENLGGITLRVVSKNGVISANIVTDSPQTKEIIEGQLTGLKTQFADQGIRFDRLEIAARQETAFDFSGQQHRQSFQEGSQRQTHHRTYVEETPTGNPDEPQPEGAVDFRA